jgi:hypothetical protein
MIDAKSTSTRRSVVKAAGCALALLGLSATGARAKSSQSSVAYRNSPRGRERCANCAYFISPRSCSAVRGAVSPNGWCDIWSG